MQHIHVNDLLGQAQEHHNKGRFKEAEAMYNAILSRHMDDASILYLLGTLYMQMGKNGLARLLLESSLKRKPGDHNAWNHLGICYKVEFFKEKAGMCFDKASRLAPDDANYPSNWAGCFINEGMPDRAIELADKALEIQPDNTQAKWHKGLALLEKQDWSAWDLMEHRLDPRSGCNTAIRNYADDGMTPWWDGKSKGLVAIHGEQGIGDEVMFSTCIEDAVATGAEIVFECTPRMASLFDRSLPCKVVGTHQLDGKEWRNGRKVDYKCAVGSLGKLFRPSDQSFPGKPYLKPNPRRMRHWKKMLAQLDRKPKIGLAWQGGVPSTRLDLRTIPLQSLEPLLRQNATFVSLQYTKHAQDEVNALKEQTGLQILHWKAANSQHLITKDQQLTDVEFGQMDDYAALVSSLDLVISVCQTAIHIAGGLGVPCWCLTPYAPAWRYGVTGNMPWYDSVTLIRQKDADWAPVIQQVSNMLELELKSKAA